MPSLLEGGEERGHVNFYVYMLEHGREFFSDDLTELLNARLTNIMSTPALRDEAYVKKMSLVQKFPSLVMAFAKGWLGKKASRKTASVELERRNNLLRTAKYKASVFESGEWIMARLKLIIDGDESVAGVQEHVVNKEKIGMESMFNLIDNTYRRFEGHEGTVATLNKGPLKEKCVEMDKLLTEEAIADGKSRESVTAARTSLKDSDTTKPEWLKIWTGLSAEKNELDMRRVAERLMASGTAGRYRRPTRRARGVD